MHFEIIQYEHGREELFSASPPINTPHCASVLIDEAVFTDFEQLDNAIQRTINVCLHLQVPIQRHFKRIYIHNADGAVLTDWALSDLAFYMLLINSNAIHTAVSQAQAFALRHILNEHPFR